MAKTKLTRKLSTSKSSSGDFFKGLDDSPVKSSNCSALRSSPVEISSTFKEIPRSQALRDGQDFVPPSNEYLGPDLFPPLASSEHVSPTLDGRSSVDAGATPSENAAKQSWSNLFASHTNRLKELKYYQPTKVNGKIRVSPPEAVRDLGCKFWENSLVGQFIDKAPPFGLVRNTVSNLWKQFGKIDVKATDEGLYFFRFENAKDCETVLSQQWHINQRPLLLRCWQPGIELLNFSFEKIPIWVKLKNVPTEYCTQEGISYVSSAVGRPLQMDALLESRTKLSFIRVCIEVDIKADLPDSFELEMKIKDKDGESSKVVEVQVEYYWKPVPCAICKAFGHPVARCPFRTDDHAAEEQNLVHADVHGSKAVGTRGGSTTRKSRKSSAFSRGRTPRVQRIGQRIGAAQGQGKSPNEDKGKAKLGQLNNRFAALNTTGFVEGEPSEKPEPLEAINSLGDPHPGIPPITLPPDK